MTFRYWCRLFFLNLLFSPSMLFGQENRITARETIEEAIIYLNGAEIHSTVNLPIKKGRNLIVIEGLSASIEDKSIQISEKSEAEMLSISSKLYQVKAQDFDPELRRLSDSIQLLKQKIERLDNEIDAYNVEKKTLLENQQLNKNTPYTIVDLSKTADFFRDRTLKINNTLSTLNNRKVKLNEKLIEDQRNFDSYGLEGNFRKQISIILSSSSENLVKISIRYLVNNAGWNPSYDLIATDITKPVTLKYKANIFNNTGINWKDIKITLSTSDPSVNASRPYLTTWNLNYESNANEGLLQNNFQNRNDLASDTSLTFDEVTVSELNTSFPIEKHYTIASNGFPFVIEVKTAILNATYQYLAVPKVDLSAFLIAKVTGWENLNLMEGIANIYFSDTYIGESTINTRSTGDTLELSLGRDNQILVTRSKIKDAGESKLIGLKKSESLKYEIQIKNNRHSPILIKVQDQIPISQEGDIIVDAEELSGASLLPESGRLQWLPKIMPGEKVSYIIAFTVKYPKNKEVNIRKSRMVRTPRFRR